MVAHDAPEGVGEVNTAGYHSAVGPQTGATLSPANTLRTNGSESFNEAFTVAPWFSLA
jgi:hypothetical protein